MEELDGWMQKWPGISDVFCTRSRFPQTDGMNMSALAVGSPDCFSLEGDVLWPQNLMPVAVGQYRDLLKEKTAKETYAKLSCGDKGPYYVGAAARAVLAAERGVQSNVNPQGIGVFDNNFAQLDEIKWALGQSIEVIQKILLSGKEEPLLAKTARPQGAGIGTAAMEAPRGLLVHHYVVDDWGYIAQADIVTPTAINQIAIRDQILHGLGAEMDIESMRSIAEQIVRAFDPCISCAVHVLGKGSRL
jgi:coenzyme F420-reducing hydrogenase alpha subunit